MTEVWIKIGVVGKPYGLRGAFFLADRKDILEPAISSVSLGDSYKSGFKSKVREQKVHKSRSVLVLQELPDRTAMERFLGKNVWAIELEVKGEIDEDCEYRWSDLLRKKVFDSEGVLLGTVKDIANYGATDVVELENSNGSCVDIALISEFFDMGFSSKDDSLSLVVGSKNFEGLWHDSVSAASEIRQSSANSLKQIGNLVAKSGGDGLADASSRRDLKEHGNGRNISKPKI